MKNVVRVILSLKLDEGFVVGAKYVLRACHKACIIANAVRMYFN
jgi:hypothetical protein